MIGNNYACPWKYDLTVIAKKILRYAQDDSILWLN